ncbi:hypothetical protein EHI8A_046130 [Entamoeba histolytica HM-1:IMSS-B]|uniref:Coiled-coil protein n=4 Tax=Entamoeba histolytica TaxID=5759 RepID=A0A175JLB9_ENTHI|nr:hypothetical protein EHI8A_046130 [Entamoeba histolytica HM-1:IMSS-B]EMS12942.1 hypothetical protein KM1_086210 [Entamoeba histolytica HM-3:IMSS]ENY62107.1 unknown protein, putative [Entamoeba histolytica HM-1:IMSS-A]GAT94223.1 coiled-coil protein [Entamoeba histolytica]
MQTPENPEITELKNQLEQLKVQKNELVQKKEEIEKQKSSTYLKSLLQQQNKQINQNCSELISKLMSNEITFDEFSTKFIELKTNSHLNIMLMGK